MEILMIQAIINIKQFSEMLKPGWLFLRREENNVLNVVYADKYGVVLHERRLHTEGHIAIHDCYEAGFEELAIGLANLNKLVTGKGLVGFFDRM